MTVGLFVVLRINFLRRTELSPISVTLIPKILGLDPNYPVSAARLKTFDILLHIETTYYM